MRRLLVMLTGLALLAPASSAVTLRANAGAVPSTATLGGLPIGCVGADASFDGQAYCLDGSHADVMANPRGSLSNNTIAFGELELNGWQVPTRCDGDGVSGKREQLVYVHVKGEPNIAAQAIPFIKARLIPGTNGVFEHTSGGKRAVRWVTKKTAAGCVPAVLSVTVPRAANVSGFPFVNIARAVLAAVGGAKSNRSYLVLVDHPDPYYECGLGEVRPDSGAGAGNRNNTGGAFAMVWSNCWTGLIAAHELTHTMGAVQPGSPHHTQAGHCWDGRDAMCYDDGSPQRQRLICTRADDFRKLDCGGDDYFALYPKTGGYLATHWNSANSKFLINAKATVLPTRPGKPTGVTITQVDPSHVRVSWTAGVTKHGALASWTVLVGATDGGTTFDDAASYPVTNWLHKVTVKGKVRSALIAVKSNVSQGFAVYATNASGDGVISAIVRGGAGTPPSPIVATYTPEAYYPGYGSVTWTGGTSAANVTTCMAVLVNGVRLETSVPPMTVEQSTDPGNGYCYSDNPLGTYLSNVAPTDLVQVLSRNPFGRQLVTIAHP